MKKGIGYFLVVGPISVLVFIVFFNLLSRTVFSPLLPVIESDLGLSHGESGSFFLFISLGYCLSMLFSGFFSKILRHRGTILLSCMAVGCSLFVVAVSANLSSLRLSLFLLGVGVGFYFPSGVATITELVEKRHWGKAMSFHEVGASMSLVMAPLLVELLLRFTGWRGVLVCVGSANVCMGLVYLLLGKGGKFPGRPPRWQNIRPIISQPSFWIIMVLFCMASGTAIGVYSILPVFLIAEKGMSSSGANLLLSISRISGVTMIFLIGWLADKFGSKLIMLIIGVVVAVLTLLMGLTGGIWLTIVVFAQPMLISSFFPAVLSALAKSSPSGGENLAVSILIPVVFLVGGGIVPSILGILSEHASFGLGFAILGGLFLVCLVGLMPLLKLPAET